MDSDLGVDLEAVWRIVAGDLPALRAALERLELHVRQNGTPPSRP